MVSLSGLLTFAATFSQVFAIGELAFNVGSNEYGCRDAAAWKSDLERLSAYTSKVRIYSASTCNALQVLGPVAEEMGFQIFVGIWPTDDSHFEAEKTALSTYLPEIKKSTVVMVTVGSEALYRKELTGSDLASRVTEIKDLLSNTKDSAGESYSSTEVGFVDSWNIITDGTANDVIPVSDVVVVNAFSYWQGQSIENSSYSFFDDIMQALQHIQTAKGSTDITFWVGETGWATEGSKYDDAVPSLENAEEYWKESICAIRGWGINVIAFEAFDESWKPDTAGTNDVEKHWGVYDSSNTLKYDLSCDFTS